MNIKNKDLLKFKEYFEIFFNNLNELNPKPVENFPLEIFASEDFYFIKEILRIEDNNEFYKFLSLFMSYTRNITDFITPYNKKICSLSYGLHSIMIAYSYHQDVSLYPEYVQFLRELILDFLDSDSMNFEKFPKYSEACVLQLKILKDLRENPLYKEIFRQREGGW